jgi:hypothetical protein
MAEENRDWATGESRARYPTWDTSLPAARSRILERHGIEPAPERSGKTTWKEFLSRHWELIVAADFFTVEVWTRRGLQRFIVLFFIDLSTRKVEIAGIAQVANGLWMSQIARNLKPATAINTNRNGSSTPDMLVYYPSRTLKNRTRIKRIQYSDHTPSPLLTAARDDLPFDQVQVEVTSIRDERTKRRRACQFRAIGNVLEKGRWS